MEEKMYLKGLIGIIIFLLIFFSYLIILIIYTKNNRKEEGKKETLFVVCSMNFMSIFTILLRTLLFLPISRVLLSVFFCSHPLTDELLHPLSHPTKEEYFTISEIGCQTEAHILICLLVAIIYLLFLLFTFMNIYFMVDEFPDSTLPWANHNPRIEFLKLIKKLALLIVFLVHFEVFIS